MISSALAIAAAFSWTCASLFGHAPARQLGSLHFNRLRMLAAFGLLILMMAGTDASWELSVSHFLPVALSAIIGVVLGDYFLFVAMKRIGPRRTGILFASNAPLAAMLGWLVLDEHVTLLSAAAILICFAGICLAIIYGKRRDLLHIWEEITPPLWIGVGAGFLAALGQAAGVLLLRPVMEAGADPLLASLVRVGLAGLVFWAILPVQKWMAPASLPQRFWPEMRMSWMIIANGFFGLSFGVALLLKALEHGNVAQVTILSATSPVMILPFIWYQTGKCPPAAAWAGAVLVVLSAAFLVGV